MRYRTPVSSARFIALRKTAEGNERLVRPCRFRHATCTECLIDALKMRTRQPSLSRRLNCRSQDWGFPVVMSVFGRAASGSLS